MFNRNSKCFISCLLVVVICITMVFSVSAVSVSPESKIISALHQIEYLKEDMGLSDINFETLTVAAPVYTYEYTENGLIQNNVMYPLKSDNALVAWAVSLDRTGDADYQITTALVDEVNAVLSDNMTFALIYDYEHCYLYDGNTCYLLKQSSIHVEGRSVLSTSVNGLSEADIRRTNIDNSVDLEYSIPIASRAQTYYQCSVSRVSQNPPSNICWAASIACIVNYKKGKSYTAVDVAQKHYGSTNFNRSLPLGDEQGILRTNYLLWYTYKNQVPGDGVIGHNIQEDFPIMATFRYSNGYHDVVIYGIDAVRGYISIMDPEAGFCSASVGSSGYRYVSAYSGVTLTLDRATCRYWSA